MQVGLLLQATRARAFLSQRALAERAFTSQQWISRVERGDVDVRLGAAERLFAAAGARLLVRTAGRGERVARDPDLLGPDESLAEALELELGLHYYFFKVFRAVPHVLGGRLAAMAQGLRVRPLALDVIIAEESVEAASQALQMMNATRWSERHQDWIGADPDVGGAGPRRWWMRSGGELRIEVVPRLRPALSVVVGERALAVEPLVSLVQDDPDVAELRRRLAAAGG